MANPEKRLILPTIAHATKTLHPVHLFLQVREVPHPLF